MQHPDVVIAGAGIIGLSLALELRRQNRDVVVRSRNLPGIASAAAAGMLAGNDPGNPAALQPLSDLALQLYPGFLRHVRSLSGHAVPIHTTHLLEANEHGQPARSLCPSLAANVGTFTLREEESLDPRELHAALLRAAKASGVSFQTAAEALDTSSTRSSISRIEAQYLTDAEAGIKQYIDCTGAWSPAFTRPAKGQMLRVELPPAALRLANGHRAVLRTPNIYIVPRLDNSALIGATVEDAGFDLTTHNEAVEDLRHQAAVLLPAAKDAPELERWSGLRPRTVDDLPVLGKVTANHFVANGLFRNGILLAPAVAHVMAQLLSGDPITVPLNAFAPGRFLAEAHPVTAHA